MQNLNQGDASPTSTNLAYGPFLVGSGSPNYTDGLHDNWSSGDFQFSNLTAGNSSLYLYSVVFSTANLGFGAISSVGNGLFAQLNIPQGRLEVAGGAVVPAPAAVWLMGTALVPIAGRAFRKRRTAT